MTMAVPFFVGWAREQGAGFNAEDPGKGYASRVPGWRILRAEAF
jgi:hypothetical protein